MPLFDALEVAIGGGQGTFISCISGVLGHFEGEEPNERYICRRDRYSLLGKTTTPEPSGSIA